jgi:hypothetical protein
MVLCVCAFLCHAPQNVWSQPKIKSKKQKRLRTRSAKKRSKIKKETASGASSSSSISTSEEEVDVSKLTPGKVIEFSQFTIEGTIPRPSAAYLLQRRKLKFRGLTPKKSFLSALFKSVERSPF